MKRRDFFKGLIGTVAVLAAKPLSALLPKQRYAHYDIGYESMGAGALDVVASTADTSIRVGNPDVFHEGQEVEIYSTCSDVLRGASKISKISGGTLTLEASVPAGTVPGDLVVLHA